MGIGCCILPGSMAYPERPIAFVLAATNHGSMIVNRNDYRMVGPESGIGVGFQLLGKSSYDAHEVSIALSLLEMRRWRFGDGVVAIDGGANVGAHTLEWARHMHGWGRVLAFEAQEWLFNALAGNLALNNCFNVRARFAALGEQPGELRVPQLNYFVPASYGGLELKPIERPEELGQPVSYEPSQLAPVPMVALDTIDFERLDLVKLDIEGMEGAALRGARRTLSRHHPVVIADVSKCDRAEVESLLSGLGYAVHDLALNLLAVHKSDPTQVKVLRDGAQVTVNIG